MGQFLVFYKLVLVIVNYVQPPTPPPPYSKSRYCHLYNYLKRAITQVFEVIYGAFDVVFSFTS